MSVSEDRNQQRREACAIISAVIRTDIRNRDNIVYTKQEMDALINRAKQMVYTYAITYSFDSPPLFMDAS